MSSIRLTRGPAIHYGWVILAAGTFGSFMTLPGQTAGVSVFFDPITTDLGISRTWASIAYAAGTLAGILPAPIIGRWIDKRGPRLTATIIAGGLVLACAYMALVQSGIMLLLGFALLRGAAIGGLSLVSQQVVNLWFVQRRGIAAAAASLGLAAGSMIFPQLIDFLISLCGWRGAYLVLALLVALTMLPVAAVLFRDRPEKFGLTTDAGLPPAKKEIREEPSFTRDQALRTGVFWLLTSVAFLTNAIGTALLLNHFSIMRTAGITRDSAIYVLGVYASVQATVTLSTGALLDYYEPRRLVPLAMLLLGTACALPAFGSGIAVSWLYALSLGGAYGAQQAIGAAGYAQYFGRDHLGAIRGASFICGISGAALGPLPFAASIDWTGSYSVALIGSLVLCLACGVGAFAVRRPSSLLLVIAIDLLVIAIDHSRPYAIHSASECQRLERQAALAGIEDHLRFVPVRPGARVLDAGCGSGSMARLFAARHPHAQVTGVDIRADYLAYARMRAAREGLRNLDFREGDIFQLPFPDASFDVVWSKYVLQWVKEPHAAIAEFARVAKPDGLIVCCNFDGFGMTHCPEDPALQPLIERVLPRIVDPFIGRKLAPIFRAAGLIDIAVDFEPDRLFTVIGSIDPARRQNWVEQWTAGRPYVAGVLGSEAAADALTAAFLAYQDRADSCSYTALYFVRGRRPGGARKL